MILHVMIMEKFLPPFIDFVDKYFDVNEHKFVFITSPKYKYGLCKSHSVEFLHTDADFVLLSEYFYLSDKIILHGLWRDKVNTLLCSNDKWMDKTYWVMWGGDFYHPDKYNDAHIQVIKKARWLVTHVVGDVQFVRDNYGATGEHISCLMYPSNIYHERHHVTDGHPSINVLVGNSASSTNNHIDIFTKLLPFMSKNISIFCPLSYGDKNYADFVASEGTRIFGDKFIPVFDFVSKEQYLDFLNKMDVAIFNHRRQQAMGNMIALLGMGKVVYMRNDVSTWSMFHQYGIKVFDFDDLSIDENKVCIDSNIDVVKKVFSEENLVKDLAELFGK
ncbi:hypothetical protein CVS42_12995 [Aeromonas veronii]|nr:hypothetical protein CVS42_12995 [Aeromonas veronii]